jgi:hypothetical protein
VVRRPPPRSEAENIAKRFREHGQYYFTSLEVPGVGPTNNAMERGFRHLVVDRKVTQGTRGERGRRWCERIWTVLATCAQQLRSAFEFIHQSVLAYFTDQRLPSLLPGPPVNAYHDGQMTWLGKPVAKPPAKSSGEMTLLVPKGIAGFVRPEDGAVTLKNILIPAASRPRPEPAIEAARRLMLHLPEAGGTATLLRVGDASDLPELQLPDVPGWKWRRVVQPEDVVDTILEMAAKVAADFVAIARARLCGVAYGFEANGNGWGTPEIRVGARRGRGALVASMAQGARIGSRLGADGKCRLSVSAAPARNLASEPGGKS